MKQRKFVFIIVFLILALSKLSAQYEFMHRSGSFIDGFGSRNSFRFSTPNRVSHGYWNPNLQRDNTRTGIYHITHEYNVPFLNITWDDGGSVRYLMLANENVMMLYSGNTYPAWNLWWLSSYAEMMLSGDAIRMHSVRASATLTEGHLVYAATPERLGPHINRVWAVEGGVGERLYIHPGSQTWRLLISGGYVHFSRPYLFQHNARPRRIQVSSMNDETQFFEMELQDTPNFQGFTFSSNGIFDQHLGIIIEILEVFPGSRYNHLCINSIMGLWSQ